ncbi:hypothetical protein [Cohnella panacarvi]|uniref:hypothetical protein n=1 Tax=Cohnella panacarvi TaxID=400776 RepID=UPI00047D7487|nr:hypothetical protein [Cohnella panacarvi]
MKKKLLIFVSVMALFLVSFSNSVYGDGIKSSVDTYFQYQVNYFSWDVKVKAVAKFHTTRDPDDIYYAKWRILLKELLPNGGERVIMSQTLDWRNDLYNKTDMTIKSEPLAINKKYYLYSDIVVEIDHFDFFDFFFFTNYWATDEFYDEAYFSI